MGVSIDISERKRGEEALRASEARLAAGAELAGLAHYEADFEAGVMYIDDRLRDLCGIPPDGEDGLQVLQFWIEHLHPADRPRMLDLREQMQDGRLERLSTEYRYLHPTRGEIWLQHLAGVSEYDDNRRALRTFGVFRDITERKRTEEQLHDLSRRLIGAHEEERALLARELHDDVTQRLAVLAIDVGRAEAAAPDTPQAAGDAKDSRGARASQRGHSRPGLPAASLGPGRARSRRGAAGRVRTAAPPGDARSLVGDRPLPAAIGRDAALCLFRVAQEALNNVARHSGAAAADVSLRQMDGGLLLAVRDDGAGFDPANRGAADTSGSRAWANG